MGKIMTAAFGKHVSLGIIWCLMVSWVGCETTKTLPFRLSHPEDAVLIVETKEGDEYRLERFEFLPDSSVSGEGYLLRYHEIPYEGTIPKSEIADLELRRPVPWSAYLAGTLIVVIVIGAIIYSNKPGFSPF